MLGIACFANVDEIQASPSLAGITNRLYHYFWTALYRYCFCSSCPATHTRFPTCLFSLRCQLSGNRYLRHYLQSEPRPRFTFEVCFDILSIRKLAAYTHGDGPHDVAKNLHRGETLPIFFCSLFRPDRRWLHLTSSLSPPAGLSQNACDQGQASDAGALPQPSPSLALSFSPTVSSFYFIAAVARG